MLGGFLVILFWFIFWDFFVLVLFGGGVWGRLQGFFVYFGVSWVCIFVFFVRWQIYMGRIESMDTSSETSSQAKDN